MQERPAGNKETGPPSPPITTRSAVAYVLGRSVAKPAGRAWGGSLKHEIERSVAR